MADNPQALARLDPQALITTALDKGAGIEVMERLVALAERVRAWQAREAYNHAIAEFHKRKPRIYKTKLAKIQGQRGSYQYNFAPLDEICDAISPIFGELGLSYYWTAPRQEAGKIICTCVIAHEDGHSENSGEIAIPIQQDSGAGGGMGANVQQRVGIALTYAHRYSLLAIAGLAPEDDNDAAEDKPGAADDYASPLMPRATVPETPKPSQTPPPNASTRVQTPLESQNPSEALSSYLPDGGSDDTASLAAEARAREEAEAAAQAQDPKPEPPKANGGSTISGAEVYRHLQALAKKRNKSETALLKELTGKTSIPSCDDSDRAKVMAVK